MSNIQVWVGGPCNTTFNIPPFSSSLAHSPINFRGAITDDICGGPGCVFQERAAADDEDHESLESIYESNCESAGGIYTEKAERDGGDATFRIGWCAVNGPGDTERVGNAMEGTERTSVWCSQRESTSGGVRLGVKVGCVMFISAAAVAVLNF